MSYPVETSSSNKCLSSSATGLRLSKSSTLVSTAEISRPHSAGSSTSTTSSKCRSGSSSRSAPGSAGARSAPGSAGARSAPGSAGARSAPGSAGSRSCGSAGSSGSRKVSDRLNPKTVDHFSSSTKNMSSFATLYNNGGIPCRLTHGSVKHKLTWLQSPEEVPFDPVLVALAEGIRETIHPYTFVARQGFKELLATSGAETKVVSIIPKLVPPIRAALGHSDVTVFEAGLDALTQLSGVAGAMLNPHLKSLMVSIAKHSMEKKYRRQITDSLQELEINGGKEALVQIKARIPTYQSVCS